MAGPRRGFNLFIPVIQPPGHAFTVEDSIKRMAQMGADSARIPIVWGGTNWYLKPGGRAPVQTSVYGPWNYDQLDDVKSLVAAARTINPSFKAVVNFGGLPPDIDGFVTSAYTNSASGWSQFGYAVSQVMNYLGDTADFVEFGNEPNYKTGPGSTNVPSDPYGGMAAYALYYLYNCCGTNPDGSLKKNALLGALATGPENDPTGPSKWTSGRSPQLWASDMATSVAINLYLLLPSNSTVRDKLNSSWRLSIHPYPRLTADTNGASAETTVWNRYNDFQSQFGSRKIWITETGASSNTVGETGQAVFWANFGSHVAVRYYNNDKRLEGVLFFGFTDCDMGMVNPSNPADTSDPFYKMGVISGTDGVTWKTAGHIAHSVFTSDWA